MPAKLPSGGVPSVSFEIETFEANECCSECSMSLVQPQERFRAGIFDTLFEALACIGFVVPPSAVPGGPCACVSCRPVLTLSPDEVTAAWFTYARSGLPRERSDLARHYSTCEVRATPWWHLQRTAVLAIYRHMPLLKVSFLNYASAHC